MKADFARCLAGLVGHSIAAGIPLVILFREPGSLDYKRTLLVKDAREARASHILWIDSDQTFPMDGLARLIKANRPIIGCNYLSRHSQRATGHRRDGSELTPGRGIESVGALGLGFCLMQMEVFEKIPAPWFASHFLGEQWVGEDVHFCNIARKAGIPIAVDHDLSAEIGHVIERIGTLGEIRNADTVLPGTGSG